jgi:hypothetical protein
VSRRSPGKSTAVSLPANCMCAVIRRDELRPGFIREGIVYARTAKFQSRILGGGLIGIRSRELPARRVVAIYLLFMRHPIDSGEDGDLGSRMELLRWRGKVFRRKGRFA